MASGKEILPPGKEIPAPGKETLPSGKEKLVQFIEQRVPNVKVEGLQFVYDAKNLRYLYQNYVNVVNAKYYCKDYFQKNHEN